MKQPPENGRDDTAMRKARDAAMTAAKARVWFVSEVLPLETVLMQYIQRNWRNQSDVADIRQEVYVRVYEAALHELPEQAKPFVLTTARNLLINRVRREQVVPIEAVADLESLGAAAEEPPPDRVVMAREELRRLQLALDSLPQRSREAVVMKQVDGLSRRDIALRMGVGEETVKRHLTNGMRALANFLYGEPTDLRRKP
ncbi:MAG TPA: RNA polymerase sigma factor [Rhizomicrobium sp.]|nr:RNA polymerase sigma factor [Rhizomicrobium sp.]